MGQINPMSEIRAIAEACRRECLPAGARLLWRVLFDCANDRQRWNAAANAYDWPDDFFPIDNAELIANSALEKRALLDARNRLKQIGAIDFKPGANDRRPARYKINYLTECRGKYAPADVPAQVPAQVPADIPADVPEHVPISKDIDIEQRKEKQRSARAVADRMQQRFDAFWAIYPRKENKRRAQQEWNRLKPDDETVHEILAAVREQMKSDQWSRDGGAYIPHPSSWLHGERWKDKPVVKAGIRPVVVAQQYSQQRDYDGEQEEAMRRMMSDMA